MEENYRINSVAAQSTYFKTKISKSKDTGIFLDTGAIDFIGKKNDVKFVIYKEDCIIALSNILLSLPLHISPAGKPSMVYDKVAMYEEYVEVLHRFFGKEEKAVYGPFDLSTTTSDRCYLYKLDHQSGFNIRKFLISDHSEITFKRNLDGTIDFRFSTQKFNSEQQCKPEGECINLSDLQPTILYGPPGTGKTFTVQTEYISKFKENLVTTFHQAFSYEEFVEGLKPVLDESSNEIKYTIEKGIFYRACEKAAILAGYASLAECLEDTKSNRVVKFNKAIEEKKTVLLCIDEINRGNVASIFGDLISLIESSKRLGAGELEMMAILPYSQKAFGVPANLFIVGTMNTADRSIQLLDSALRRRFKFEELLPNYDVIDNDDAEKILRRINARVRCLLNKDNQIGHSYLMFAQDYCEILSALYNKIIPLLEEFFYNDIHKVRFVLNDNDNGLFYVEDSEAKAAYEIFQNEEIDDEDRDFFELNPAIADAIESKDESECKKYLANLLK